MAEERVQRRLAAILAADAVGYSRLMGVDEEATLRTLKSYREIIDRLIVRHEGRIFGTGGGLGGGPGGFGTLTGFNGLSSGKRIENAPVGCTAIRPALATIA